MGPENRKPSFKLSPLQQQGGRIAGGAMASLALVMMGFASPAMAHTQVTNAPTEVRGGGGCKHGKGHHTGGKHAGGKHDTCKHKGKGHHKKKGKGKV
ncbi:hypothetical protein E4099_09400, partial [Streptomyces palmae]